MLVVVGRGPRNRRETLEEQELEQRVCANGMEERQ